MFDGADAVGLQAVPESSLYPIAVVVVLLATAVALSTGHDWIGATGVFSLSLLSLLYGAAQPPDDE